MDIDSPAVQEMATAIECFYYAREHMAGKPRFDYRDGILRHAIENMAVPGLVLEFGVAQGVTINLIADTLPNHIIYGFDSFEGLPEKWEKEDVGAFAQPCLPAVRPNVRLIEGWFDRTLPGFLDDHPDEVSLLHIDCDLYSSTQTVLQQLRSRIVPGTIIAFDEYFNYPTWRQHEFRAFQEFTDRYKVRYEYIGLVPRWEQVAVRVLSGWS